MVHAQSIEGISEIKVLLEEEESIAKMSCREAVVKKREGIAVRNRDREVVENTWPRVKTITKLTNLIK